MRTNTKYQQISDDVTNLLNKVIEQNMPYFEVGGLWNESKYCAKDLSIIKNKKGKKIKE